MAKRILVILGHPAPKSYCRALSETYVAAARAAGHEVRQIALCELNFDPILHNGYASNQELEPDLLMARDALTWAQHIVFVYPIWWGAMPALLKGFIDRVFLPGFAFKYRTGSPFWDRLLTGRSAHLLVTMDTPPWYFRWIFRQPGHNQMKRTILEFSGVKPVKVSSFGSIKASTPERRENWLKEVAELGRRA